MNNGTEPAMGRGEAYERRDRAKDPTAMVITKLFAQTLDMAISNGVSGMTRRWSMVPCSRSRTIAAPARIMPSMVTLLMMPMTLVNHAVSILG